MSELDAEKEQELNELHQDWLDKLDAYFAFQNQHPPAHRTLEEMREVHRLEGIAMWAQYQYQLAKEQRRRV